MNLRKFESLLDTLEKLRELSRDMPVIVEGKRDERSLRKVGVVGEIFKAQNSTSLVEFSDSIANRYREVVLFTDLDSAGKKIGSVVKKYLTDKGVKVNERIAKRIMLSLDTVEAENVSKLVEKAYGKFIYP